MPASFDHQLVRLEDFLSQPDLATALWCLTPPVISQPASGCSVRSDAVAGNLVRSQLRGLGDAVWELHSGGVLPAASVAATSLHRVPLSKGGPREAQPGP